MLCFLMMVKLSSFAHQMGEEWNPGEVDYDLFW